MEKELLAIGMIVKNEEQMLKNTLSSLLASRLPIYILDTGSEDNTINYLKAQNVQVFPFSNWNHDFSTARNTLLEKVQSKWILFLDADEYISPLSFSSIIELVSQTEHTFFYFPIYQNNLGETKTNVENNYRVKLFRNDLNYRYIRPINEILKIDAPFNKANYLNIPLFHWGNSDPEKYQKKLQNYVEAFKNALYEPGFQKDSMLYFQLGRSFKQLGKNAEALPCFQKAVLCSPNNLITKFMYYSSLTSLLVDLNKSEKAEKILRALEKKYKTLNKPLYFILGKIVFNKKYYNEARAYFLKSLVFYSDEEEKNTTYVFEIKGFFQNLYLGIIEELAGNIQAAKKYYLEAKCMKEDELVDQLLARIER